MRGIRNYSSKVFDSIEKSKRKGGSQPVRIQFSTNFQGARWNFSDGTTSKQHLHWKKYKEVEMISVSRQINRRNTITNRRYSIVARGISSVLASR